MKKLFYTFFFITALAYAQPKVVLGPGGIPAAEVTLRATPVEKLMELSKNWALEFNRRGSYDITNVTAASMTITAGRDNAFFYRSKGETYQHNIRYDMVLDFNETGYTVSFTVKEIYADGVLIDYTLPDYFTSDGKLKEDFTEIKPSIEATVNYILKSHYDFIMSYR